MRREGATRVGMRRGGQEKREENNKDRYEVKRSVDIKHTMYVRTHTHTYSTVQSIRMCVQTNNTGNMSLCEMYVLVIN